MRELPRNRPLLVLALLCPCLIPGAGCVQRNPATQKLGVRLVPRGVAADIGRRLVARQLDHTPVSDDLRARRRVWRVAEQIASAAGVEAAEDTLHLYLVVDDTVNAFALPGQNILMTTGFLDFVRDNDDLLAAALAHEIAHVRARHVIQKLEAVMARRQMVLIGRIDAHRDLRTGLRWLDLDRGEEFVNRAYEREQEMEADRIAVQYLHAAGYPPEAMGELLEEMSGHVKPHGKRARSSYTAAHPSLRSRIGRLKTELAALRRERAGQEEKKP